MRASSSEIKPHRSFFRKNIAMCSHKKASQPGYRNLVFCDRHVTIVSTITNYNLTALEIFSYEHVSPVTGMKLKMSSLVYLGNRTEMSHRNKRQISSRVCLVTGIDKKRNNGFARNPAQRKQNFNKCPVHSELIYSCKATF